MSILGNYLYSIRKSKNESLREFSNRCGISHTHLDSIEKGFDPRTGKPVNITTSMLQTIAKGLNLNYAQLAIMAEPVDLSKIRSVRTQIGESEDAVSAALGIPVSQYQAIESGQEEPSISILMKIADHFHYSIDSLLNFVWDIESPETTSTISRGIQLTPKEEAIVLRYRLADETDQNSVDSILSRYASPQFESRAI